MTKITLTYKLITLVVILFPLRDEDKVNSSIWQFYAIGGADETKCELLDFLANFSDKTPEYTAALALIALIKMVQSEVRGPLALRGTSLCHEAIDGEGVYEFIKKPLRIYWFYGEGEKIVICAYGIIKRHTKTDKQDRKRLIELRDKYIEDVATDCIFISRRRRLS